MGRTTSWADEFTLLCERCGYVVEGLDPAGACPECGKAIAESLPERRVGTPWQREPGVGSLVRTWLGVMMWPYPVLREVRADQKVLGLRLISISIATVLFSAASHGFRWSWKHFIRDGEPLPAAVHSQLINQTVWTVLGVFILLIVLTSIEQYGLVLFSKRHHTRVRPDLAHVICDHGCTGWVLAATGAALGSILVLYASIGGGAPYEEFDSSEATILLLIMWLGHGIAGISIILGFLFFETFAWLGLRRCKYANRARVGGDEPRP